MVQRAERLVMGNGDVRRLLGKKRYIKIGTGLRQVSTEPHERSWQLLVVFYDYTDDLTIEVRVDAKAGEVLSVSQNRSQPTAVETEVEEAIRLARSAPTLLELLTPELEGNALLVKGVDIYDRQSTIPHYYHRLFEVSFRRPNERGPLYQALVDLSAQAVIEVWLLEKEAAIKGAKCQN
jgi:hypothetical protein